MGNNRIISTGTPRKILPSKREISAIAELGAKYKILDEEKLFWNLVNPSLNKRKPYYGWARYREAYSGELVKELIRRSRLSPSKHFIYDPMAGSGSTLLGAMESNFDSVGNDINPYAVDVTNAKLFPYSKKNLELVEEFIATSKIPKLTGKRFFNRTMQNCQHYFKKTNAHDLQKIINQIAKVEDIHARDLLVAIWLTILEDCSDRKKDGNGLATRPTKVSNVWIHYRKAVANILKDIRSNPLPRGVLAQSFKDTAFNAESIIKKFSGRTKKKLGAIIFSPPYANSFDYFESYKLELLCGYYTPTELATARQTAIRSFRKGYGYDLVSDNKYIQSLCEEIRRRIPLKEQKTGVVDNRSRLVPNLLVGYFQDMGKTLEAFAKSMPKNSYCYIVVDQSAYLGVVVPSDLLLAEIGSNHGLKVEQIIKCRTAKTSGQQLKEYPELASILRESIVVLRK